jgi:uncharacterized protein (TIGR02246 family)
VPANAQLPLTTADSTQISEAPDNWGKAWRELDAELAVRAYAEDADWTNAFGTRRIGRSEIRLLLEDIFHRDCVTAGVTEYEFHDMRPVGEGVVVVRSRSARTGQLFADGTVQAPRHVNHQRVYVKRNGRWLITSHLIMDERTRGQPDRHGKCSAQRGSAAMLATPMCQTTRTR